MKKITKDENGENSTSLSLVHEVALIHCNIVNNDYQQDSRVLYTFVLYKPFVQLLDISPRSFIFLKILTQSFHVIKYGLVIRILNHLR